MLRKNEITRLGPRASGLAALTLLLFAQAGASGTNHSEEMMADDTLKASQSPGGAHHLLAQMAGEWEGTAKTWFQPGKLADESPISGTIRAALDGRFVIHEYKGSLQGKPLSGVAIHGYDLQQKKFTMAWVDSFHNSTAIMLSETKAEPAGNSFSVLGSYPAGNERWGWRTSVEVGGKDRLVITHFNITPQGEEAKAVEIQYRRRR